MKRWLLLGTLGLAVLAGLGLLLTRSPRYEPTGDALYDRYARHVLKQMQVYGYNQLPPGDWSWFYDGPERWPVSRTSELLGRLLPNYVPREVKPRTMNFSALRDWEADFKNDPRYWQLLVNCGLIPGLKEAPDDMQPGDKYEPGDYVQRLLDGGFDANSLDCVSVEGLYWNDDALCSDLLQRQISADPDNGFWHFRYAVVLIDLGEDVTARAELEAANTAPEFRVTMSFPWSTLGDPRYASSTAPGNQLVRGQIALSQRTINRQMLDIMRCQAAYKDCALMLLLGGSTDLADALTRSAGRLGRADGILPETMKVAASCGNIPAKGFADEVLEGPPLKDTELMALLGQQGAVESALGKRPGWQSIPGVVPTRFLSSFSSLSAGMLGGPGSIWSYPELAPLTRADWLNFALIYDSDRKFCQSCAPLFDPLDHSPMDRIYKAVLNGSYELPADAGK